MIKFLCDSCGGEGLIVDGICELCYNAGTQQEVSEMRKFETGATRNTNEDKFDYEGFLSPRALKSFASYMHTNRLQADGKLRDSDNWQKGIPLESYMKSMFRHFFAVWENHRGVETDEDIETSLCALLFNVQGYLHEIKK